RIAAFDLDGTVFREGRFLAGIDESLRHLQQLGIRPMLVTGRNAVTFQSIGPIPEGFKDPILLHNGNSILYRTRNRVEADVVLPRQVLQRLIACDGADLVVETTEALYATTARAAIAYARCYRQPRSSIVVNPAGAARAAALAVVVFSATAGLNELLADTPLDVDQIAAYNGQVLRPAGTCKALAVSRILSCLDLAEVIAFGDGYNDACLLAAAGRGVAVEGADDVALRYSSVQLEGPLPGYLLSLTAADLSSLPVEKALCRGVHLNPRRRT
ncbi:HAD hydrolase family protein, partial [Nonomuraea sp. NPDC004297]